MACFDLSDLHRIDTVIWLTSNIVLSIAMTAVPIVLLIATVRAGNLHINFRLPLGHLCVLLIIRVLAQIATDFANIFALFHPKFSFVPFCQWELLPQRTFILAFFVTFPLLLIERSIATVFYAKYEKLQFVRTIGIIIIVLQSSAVFVVLPGMPWVPSSSEGYCIESQTNTPLQYSWFLFGLLAAVLSCTVGFHLLAKFNRKRLVAMSSASVIRVTARYQVKENLKTTRSMTRAGVPAALWMFLYVINLIRRPNCARDADVSLMSVLSLVALSLPLLFVYLSYRQLRVNVLRTLGLHRMKWLRKICATLPTSRYRVSDTQQVSSTSQQHYFETLSRQWEEGAAAP